MNVNLQVVELEQHIYGMMDVGRGVTKDRRTIYIIYIISVAQCITVYVGLAQARPNNSMMGISFECDQFQEKERYNLY